jgi:hypothetical protein
VTSGNSSIGSAIFASHPTNSGSQVSRDISQIKLSSGVAVGNPMSQAGAANSAISVDVPGSQTVTKSASVMGKAAWIKLLASAT